MVVHPDARVVAVGSTEFMFVRGMAVGFSDRRETELCALTKAAADTRKTIDFIFWRIKNVVSWE